MRRLAILALALPLMAFRCGGDAGPVVSIPQLPDLPAEVQVPCPPAEQLTGELGDLSTKDARLAVEYAKCRARAATSLRAYLDAQRELRDAAAKVDRAKSTPGRP